MRSLVIVTIAGTLAVVLTGPTLAKDKAKPRSAAPQTCARGSYPGDPVCDLADGLTSLPMPSGPTARRDDSGGLRVDENVTVSGKNDFNGYRYGGTYLNNPNPNPRSQDVNGGGSLGYKF